LSFIKLRRDGGNIDKFLFKKPKKEKEKDYFNEAKEEQLPSEMPTSSK